MITVQDGYTVLTDDVPYRKMLVLVGEVRTLDDARLLCIDKIKPDMMFRPALPHYDARDFVVRWQGFNGKYSVIEGPF